MRGRLGRPSYWYDCMTMVQFRSAVLRRRTKPQSGSTPRNFIASSVPQCIGDMKWGLHLVTFAVVAALLEARFTAVALWSPELTLVVHADLRSTAALAQAQFATSTSGVSFSVALDRTTATPELATRRTQSLWMHESIRLTLTITDVGGEQATAGGGIMNPLLSSRCSPVRIRGRCSRFETSQQAKREATQYGSSLQGTKHHQ